MVIRSRSRPRDEKKARDMQQQAHTHARKPTQPPTPHHTTPHTYIHLMRVSPVPYHGKCNPPSAHPNETPTPAPFCSVFNQYRSAKSCKVELGLAASLSGLGRFRYDCTSTCLVHAAGMAQSGTCMHLHHAGRVAGRGMHDLGYWFLFFIRGPLCVACMNKTTMGTYTGTE